MDMRDVSGMHTRDEKTPRQTYERLSSVRLHGVDGCEVLILQWREGMGSTLYVGKSTVQGHSGAPGNHPAWEADPLIMMSDTHHGSAPCKCRTGSEVSSTLHRCGPLLPISRCRMCVRQHESCREAAHHADVGGEVAAVR